MQLLLEGMIIKTKLATTIAFLVFINVNLKSQTENEDAGKTYFGLHGGFSTRKIEGSNYHFFYGGTILYNWENNLSSSSITRSSSLYIGEKIKDQNKSYSNKIDFTYGKIYRLAEKHKLFNRVYFIFFTGASFTSFNYFEDEAAWKNNRTKNLAAFGIPLGIGWSGNFGGSTYSNFVFRYHIVQKLVPCGEYYFNFFVRIF